MASFDVVFTDTMATRDVIFIHMLKGLFERNAAPGRPPSLSLIDLSDVQFTVMASYFVNPRSHGRVVECLGRGLAAGPQLPVDLHLRREANAGRIKAGLLFPFVSSVTIDTPSTIAPQTVSEMVQILLRNSFFIEADIAQSRRAVAKIMEGPGPLQSDPHLDLISDILRFIVSNRYQNF